MTKTKTGKSTTKLTADLTASVANLLRAGAAIDAACRTVGISQTSFFDWIRRGREESSGPYAEFYNAITKALADAENSLVFEIRQAGRRHWQAYAWLLERRFRERWARELPPKRTERTGMAPPTVGRRDDGETE